MKKRRVNPYVALGIILVFVAMYVFSYPMVILGLTYAEPMEIIEFKVFLVFYWPLHVAMDNLTLVDSRMLSWCEFWNADFMMLDIEYHR